VQFVAGSEPFAHAGHGVNSRVGVVISHGFTGSPASMRPWAQHLADRGFAVCLPRLPGHGTTWQHMNTTRWPDWYGEIRRAYDELAESCDLVFACGLSMGGTLVTKLAEDEGGRPDSKLRGLVLVNPAYGTRRRDAAFAKYIAWAVPSLAGFGSDIKKAGSTEPGYDRNPLRALVSLQILWRVVVADLAKITVPILYFHSAEDHVVDQLSAELLHAGAVSTTVEERTLHNSYHVATMDNDAEQIFSDSVQFFAQHVGSLE
jgi:carboxylesterase